MTVMVCMYVIMQEEENDGIKKLKEENDKLARQMKIELNKAADHYEEDRLCLRQEIVQLLQRLDP